MFFLNKKSLTTKAQKFQEKSQVSVWLNGHLGLQLICSRIKGVPSHRFSSSVIRAMLILFGLGIVLLASCKPSPPTGMNDPGQLIYLGYKDTFVSCKRCHNDEGEGSLQGPDIRDAIKELGRDKVSELIVMGKKSDDYEEDMPAFGEDLSGEEIEFVLDFITHWGKQDSVVTDSAKSPETN